VYYVMAEEGVARIGAMAEQPPEHCNNAESCDNGPPATRISFHTIDMLAEWLQTSLGDKSVAVGEALAEAFEEQARNAMGPKKPQPTPFSPPPALLELLDNLPHHMQMQQKVIHLPYVWSPHPSHPKREGSCPCQSNRSLDATFNRPVASTAARPSPNHRRHAPASADPVA
jgi:hypothetical protein